MSSAAFVLLHGWACPTVNWRPVAERLAAAGHRVEVPALLGYGPPPGASTRGDTGWTLESGWTLDSGRTLESGWTLEAAAHDVGRLLERLGPPAVVVGHSLGGSVAATLAATRPDLVAGVGFVGMVPVAPSAATAERLRRLFPAGGGPATREAIETCLTAWYTALPADPGALAELEAPFLVPPAVLQGSLRAALAGVAPEVPGKITAPVAVVLGARDRTRPPQEVEALLRGHPEWSLTLVEGAGHMVQWEAPGPCAEALSALATAVA